ncbi:hypothetical protein DY000_02015015, partial [Brassica cretica]
EILKECDDRKVLFDNRRNIPKSKKDKQVQDLLNFVEQISKKNNGKPFMADLSLELRENEATLEEKQKQIQAMKGQSKQEIAQDILKECDDRKVLFDNRRNIPKSKKDKQVQDLLNFVEQISKKNNGKPFMADLSLELRENEATLEEKQKQIQAMKGQSKQEIAQVKKEMEKTYNEMLEGIKGKIANQLKESLNDVKEQLAKAQVAREEAEKKMNQLTFENKQLAPIKILSKSIRLLKDWEHAQIKPPQAPNIPPPPFPNQIAASSTTVCFTDAAWNKATNEAGLAWIFTTRSGQEISRGCLYQEHVSPALMAESLAIRAALGHAASLDITIIWLRSDCKGLIQAITTNHRSVELFGVLADIESIISIAFLFFHASFLPRSQNGPADSLAKASLCNKTSVLGPSPH